MDLICNLVDEAYQWLQQHEENVVVIHCGSGKGRAGVATVCLLFYIGFLDTMEECIGYYNNRRFTDCSGITQPCQLRFLFQYEAMCNNYQKLP
jgi:protein-tyrosine phosphatase